MKRPCVYILAAKRNGTLYVGVTSEILRRGWEHKSGAVSGFTKIYGIHLLVHVEFYGTMPEAIAREKQIKNWKRAWKIELIERDNPAICTKTCGEGGVPWPLDSGFRRNDGRGD